MSRGLIALLALTGLLWASVGLSVSPPKRAIVSLKFICDTAESAERVGTKLWWGTLPADCHRFPELTEPAKRSAEVHDIVKIIAREDDTHMAVAYVRLIMSGKFGYSAGITKFYIS